MLHIAQPFLEKSMHPTVIVRGYVKALEDAIKMIDDLSFPVDVHDRDQMLKLVNSCIGTKFTNQFGDLMAVGGDLAAVAVCWAAKGLLECLPTKGSRHSVAGAGTKFHFWEHHGGHRLEPSVSLLTPALTCGASQAGAGIQQQ